MIHYRKQNTEGKKNTSKETPVAVGAVRATAPAPNVVQKRSTELVCGTATFQVREAYEDYQKTKSWWDTGSGSEDSTNTDSSWYHYASAGDISSASSDNEQRSMVLPTRVRNRPQYRVLDYEETDRHEERNVRMLVGKLATFYQLGDGVDPFNALPQFESGELDSLWLMRKCKSMAIVSSPSEPPWWTENTLMGTIIDIFRHASFCVTSDTHKVASRYVTTALNCMRLKADFTSSSVALLSHPHILLSATILTSTWVDEQACCPGDSKRTALIKSETLSMINQRLRVPGTRLDDATLMVILHLLAGEMRNCNEKTIRIHMSGVARLIAERGGMEGLANETVAEVATACCYHCDIFCERKSLPIFQEYMPSGSTLEDMTTFLPESPLYCPRSDFETLVDDVQCSPYTYRLLSDMRDLTDLFLSHNLQDIEKEDLGGLETPLVNHDIKVSEIRARLANLPSAYTPGLPTSSDWVYEACRLAALIYAAAIIMQVPFSVAADRSCNRMLFDPDHSNPNHGGHTPLVELLYEVSKLTDISNVWNDMAGVLYWVSAVGAAASRTPATLDMSQLPRFRDEAYSVWVRRCHIMTSARTMIVLVFQHPRPIIMAQKKLLKVQELLGACDAGRLLT